MPFIDPASLKALMDSEEEFLLIDIRDPDARKDYHIGGLNIPLNMLYLRILQMDPPKGIRIIIYCNKGKRGRIALKVLHRAGYENAACLEGGVEAWKAVFGRNG